MTTGLNKPEKHVQRAESIISDIKMELNRTERAFTDLEQACIRVLKCPALNQDNLEGEDLIAINDMTTALNKVRSLKDG